MANGRIINWYPWEVFIVFLEDQVATASSPWKEIPAGLTEWSFQIDSGDTLEEGATDATVDIMVLNDETIPASSVDGTIIATLTTASLGATFTGSSFRLVKLKKTAGTTPVALTVYGRFTQTQSR